MILLQKELKILNKNNKINKTIYYDQVKFLENDLLSKNYYISRYA